MNRSRKTDPGGRRWQVYTVCLRCVKAGGWVTPKVEGQLAEMATEAVK